VIAKNREEFLGEVIAKRVGEGEFRSQRAFAPWLRNSAAAKVKTRTSRSAFASAVPQAAAQIAERKATARAGGRCI